jgi:two-component system, OmpR family, sensor histidine kinase CiaH
MILFKKKRLLAATTVYWILLAYIVAGMAWWFIALEIQNRQLSSYKRRELKPDDPGYVRSWMAIDAEERRKRAGYIGEGSTFLGLILLGAIYVYREVRRQIRLQGQQQNFMMAVTHELKTPISVTKLNLETILRHSLDDQKRQRMIQAALQETNRLDTLANNILVASQLEVGGYDRMKERLDLSALASISLQDYRRRHPERSWEEAIQPGCTVLGDTLLLQLLVNNLLENAIKYSPPEARTTLAVECRGRQVLLSVKDEGQGVPDEEKKKVFGKFYRTGQEETRRTKGTGLGLYLCRKIADDHNATLRVTDNHPVGSIFTVAFKTET